MTTDSAFPTVEQRLPEMMEFASGLADDYESGNLQSWQELGGRVKAFFSPEMLDKVDAVAPGWRAMSAHGDGVTLVHILCAFIGLLVRPEYKRAGPVQQELSKWIVLFHDIAKQVREGKPDRIHAFRSAAMAGAALPGLGFAVAADYGRHCDAWIRLVNTATVNHGSTADLIQDNRKLPEIVDGIGRLFGRGTPAALIVKGVLFHMSINLIEEYPTPAPLTDFELGQYFNSELLALQKLMSLADSDGWELFRPISRDNYRQQTLAVFGKLESLVNG